MTSYNFNDMEKEVCLLFGAVELIDSIVNFSILQMTKQKDGTCQILPKTTLASNLLAIRSVDFISPAGNILNNKGSKDNLLFLLSNLCQNPILVKPVSNPEHFTPHVRVKETSIPENWKP